MWKLKRRKQKKIWRKWESSLLLAMMLLNTQCLVDERSGLMLISMEQLFTVSRLRFKLLPTRFNQNQIHFWMKVTCSQQKQKNLDLETTKLRSLDQRIKSEQSLVNQLEKACLQSMWRQDQITMSLQLIVHESSTSFIKLQKCWIFQLIKSIILDRIPIIHRFCKRKPMGKWKNDLSLLLTISS